MIEKVKVFISNSAAPPVHRMREDYDKKIVSSCQHVIETNNEHIQEDKK